MFSNVFLRIIPLHYQVIIVGSGRKWPDGGQLQEYGHHVRHIHSDHLAGDAPHCPNVFSAACWSGASAGPKDIQALITLPITRLSIDVKAFFSPTQEIFDFCSRITHLDLSNKGDFKLQEVLPHFLVLSHLSIFATEEENVIRESLDIAKGLKVVILLADNVYSPGDEPYFEAGRKSDAFRNDRRVVYLGMRCMYIEDWEVGAWGGEDMWVFAEDIIRGRPVT